MDKINEYLQEQERIQEQRPRVAEAMRRRGGGFVQALGEALSKADQDNTLRIRKAFPEYWMQYLEWADKNRFDKEDK